MVWIVPPDLEDAVYAAARAALGDAPLATGALTRSITDRSRRYTSERDRLSADRTADLAARAVFFTVADALKLAIPLGELTRRAALPAARPLRVLDLGAGCGAMSLGAIVALPGVPLEILALDHDAPALAIARAAVRHLAAARAATVAITTRDDDATRARLPAADLVVIGTLLNELSPDAQLAVVERALAAIPDDGAVIVIEPALRDTSRQLHALRDAVLASQRAHVFAPCTRTAAPCPALADPDDWCHEDRAVQLPPRTAELARITHLRDAGLKFSYLVLRRTPLALVDTPLPAYRVVSALHPAKGKLELLGCSAAGRTPIRLLRRHRTPTTRAFERAARGDVLLIDTPPGPDRLDVTADSQLTRLTPADADD
jgi:precorrin-6B methylase 2